jgi:hypothetical protein
VIGRRIVMKTSLRISRVPRNSNVIDIDPKDVKVGMPVEIVYEDHPSEDFTLPKFRPATT